MLLSPEQRFWSKIDLDWETGCWNWLNAKSYNGYGQFKYNGKMIRSHRFSYELLKDKIPPKMVINHICENRLCCNPKHLEVVTQSINCKKGNTGENGYGKFQSNKTHCPRGHIYDKQNTYSYNDGKRRCKKCKEGVKIG